jgi:peptide/nickel transport system permease protein
MARFYVYLLKRLMYSAVTLVAVSMTIFLVTQVLPGNAATSLLGRYATEGSIVAVERQLGLNQPIYVQYIDWFTGILTGDWGRSFRYSEPVSELVFPRFVRSMQLALLTLVLVVIFGIGLGVLAAIKRDSLAGMLVSTGTYASISLPEYVVATFLVLLFAGPVFNVLPNTGYVPLREGAVPWLQHLILPALSMTFLLMGYAMRQTRSEMIEVLQSEYIRTARLKGLSEYRVITSHALRNGLLPTITVIAFNFGYMLGGIVVVEQVFAFPGLGRIIIASIQNRDLPMIQGTILLVAAVYLFANLVADLLYTKLDPRIGYGGE